MSKKNPCRLCGSTETKTVNDKRDLYRCEDCASCRARRVGEVAVGDFFTDKNGDAIMHIGSGLGVNMGPSRA